MTNLTGSEKQIAWAEEIRTRYIENAEVLKDAINLLGDTTQEEYIDHDPIFGDETRKRYTKNLTAAHTAACATATNRIGEEAAKTIRQAQFKRFEELRSTEHGDRTAIREMYESLLGAVENIIGTETKATYYIDHRA